MYKEETGDADMDSNSSSETNPALKPGAKAEELQHHGTGSTGQGMEPKSDEMNDVEMMGSDVNSTFQSEYGGGKTREGRKQGHESSLFQDGVVDTSCGSDRFMAAAAAGYHISELERFGNIGGVSLTLGLQQCEGGGRMGMHDASHNAFMPLRETDVYNTTASAMGNETADFECMDTGNRQHRLVSSLLPSFT